MLTKKYRVGIIGCGGIGGNYASAFRTLRGRAEVVAACDIVKEKANEFAKQWEVPSAYTDMHQMLSQEALDIVGVTTHNREHVAPTIAAAEAGVKAVLCEKPMALSMGDAERVIHTCERSGTKLAIDHTMRFEPNWRRVKQMVDEGAIGNLLHIEVQNYGDTSTLLHNGTHSCDAIRFFGGDADWVIGTVNRSDARERVTSFFGLKNGATALFQTGGHWDYRLDGCFILEGTDGKIGMRPHRGWQPLIRLWRKDEGLGDFREGEPIAATGSEILGESTGNPPSEGAWEMVACLDEDRESISSGYDGLAALEMCLAAYESERQGRVKISFPLTIKESPLELMLRSGRLPYVPAREYGWELA
jgi:predicted dehydrogenase